MRNLVPITLALILALAGCGGSPEHKVRLINDSPSYATTQDLENWWVEAQQSPIYMNPITVLLNPSLTPDVRPVDARAFSIQPENVEFMVVPNSKNGIPCPGTALSVCFGQTFLAKEPILVKIADADIHKTSVYEFQNIIMWKLGYSVKER